MKIIFKEPVFDHPLKAQVEARLVADSARLKEIGFDEIRAALSVSSADLPDGAIYQIALDAGYKVEP